MCDVVCSCLTSIRPVTHTNESSHTPHTWTHNVTHVNSYVTDKKIPPPHPILTKFTHTHTHIPAQSLFYTLSPLCVWLLWAPPTPSPPNTHKHKHTIFTCCLHSTTTLCVFEFCAPSPKPPPSQHTRTHKRAHTEKCAYLFHVLLWGGYD